MIHHGFHRALAPLHGVPPAPGGDGAPAVRLPLVLAATAIAMFAINLDFFALNLAIPGMASDLGVSTTDMQWAVSGYMLALAAFLIPGGRLGDIVGRRRMLVAGLVVFGAGSLASGLAPSAGVMIGFRIVQGIGAAILFPLCIAVITNAFPEARRKRAIGNLYGLGALATALGPFVGGFLTGVLSWRWVLLINVPVVLAAIALTLRAVPESRDENVPRRIDLGGLALVAFGIAALSYAVDRGDGWGWTSGRTVGLLATGVALIVAFVAVERRVRWPLVDLSLFRNRPYVAITLLGMVANVVFVATTFASTLYLQDVRDYSPTEAGAIFLAASATLGVAGPLSGYLGERLDIPRLMAAAIGVGAIGLIAVAADSALAVYLPGLAAFGIGYGLCWSMASVGTQSVVSTARAGEASGVTLAIVIGVAGLAVALTASLIEVVAAGGTGEGSAVEEILRALAIGSVALAVPLAALGSGLSRRRAEAPSR